ncbi:MAG: AraC family transcriptional regulator [Spirochaetia bacterium]|nr:AraC family transcriptional regulator [Spirochaetia bacterium]
MIDYYERVGLAIDFIERHLTDPIQVADVAKAAFSSQWHFQRVFRYLAGCSVAEYLRNRRLSEAGYEILASRAKIIDVALKYQYGAPETFTRAFRKNFGFNPLESRQANEIEFFSPINIHEDRYKDIHSSERISEKTAVRGQMLVSGISRRVTMQDNQNERDIPEFWRSFHTKDIGSQIPNRKTERTLLGVYTEWDYDEGFRLTVGAEVTKEPGSPSETSSGDQTEWSSVVIPPQKYVVFTVQGAGIGDLLAGWKYIYGTWLPRTKRERAPGFDFDLFDERFDGSEKSLSDIYIPVG